MSRSAKTRTARAKHREYSGGVRKEKALLPAGSSTPHAVALRTDPCPCARGMELSTTYGTGDEANPIAPTPCCCSVRCSCTLCAAGGPAQMGKERNPSMNGTKRCFPATDRNCNSSR